MIEWNIKRRYRAFAWLAANIKFSTEVLYPRLAKASVALAFFYKFNAELLYKCSTGNDSKKKQFR